jgi:hypothetical protein
MQQQEIEFQGATYVKERDYTRLKKKYDRVFAFMQDADWHTLREISEATDTPEATASATLRAFRNKKNGGHVVERRYVDNGLYVYRLLENK